VFLDMFGEPKNYESSHKYLSLDSVCSKITDGEHGTVKRLETGRLYLMARNIGKDNKLNMSEISYISEDDHQRIFKRCNPELGDILLVCVGATIGKVALVPNVGEFSLARSVALIKPKKNVINSSFLLYLFKSDWMQNHINKVRNTSAQSGLYTGQIKALKVPVPPIELQIKFGEIVNGVVKYVENSSLSNGKDSSLFNALSQKAFSGSL